MAILENIRKRTTVLILIIGMALFAFVISDVLTRGGGLGGGNIGSTVGEINGEDIGIDAFRQQMEAAQGTFGASATSTQMVNRVWDQTVRNTLLDQEFERLGIDIQQDQIMNLIRTNPTFTQNPNFQDADGNFDEDAFLNTISDLRLNSPAQYAQWLQTEEALMRAAKEQTYFDLIRAGIGATLKEGEWDYRMSNDKVDISYVRVPYTSIPDSTISVSKEEIAAYMKENEGDFKQEAARDIRYVYFRESASEADEQKIQDDLAALLEDEEVFDATAEDSTRVERGFRNATDMAAFLDRNSDTPYDTTYISRRVMPAQFADSILNLQVGEVYGPYKENNTYKYTRMMGRKAEGAVKASHILVAYQGALRANPTVTRTQEEAETRAQELLQQARENEGNFAQLARDNSDGPSAPQGGDLGFFQEGIMTPAFNDFAFGNEVGTIDLVETEFGYHIVKVDAKEDVVQIATLSRNIEPSEETINALFTEATSFEMAVAESPETFGGIAEENGYSVRPVNKIKAMDENLPGIGAQRRIVQWAFNRDTEIGDIRRFDLSDGYAVAQLTATYREGLMATEDASVQVLPILRREKKAAQIIAANAGKDMQTIAADNNVQVSTASALNIKSPTIPAAGREPLVIGTAMSMEQGATSDLIEGETGVFVIQVTGKQASPEMTNYAPYATSLNTALGPRVTTGVYEALKSKADIEDNRSDFY